MAWGSMPRATGVGVRAAGHRGSCPHVVHVNLALEAGGSTPRRPGLHVAGGSGVLEAGEVGEGLTVEVCVCVCVCVREFTFEKVVGAQLFSFMGEKGLGRFSSLGSQVHTQGIFHKGIFFFQERICPPGGFSWYLFLGKKVVYLWCAFWELATTWARAIWCAKH